MRVDPRLAPEDGIGDPELVVDALLGYGQRDAPRGEAARLVAAVAGCRALSLDVPTGLDPDSGHPRDPVVRAQVTLTLAAPKRGLGAPGAAPFVGRLLLADISVPPGIWMRVGAEAASLFGRGPIEEITLPPA